MDEIRSTSPAALTPSMAASAAVSGLACAALSVDRHPGLVRGLGLGFAAAFGAWTALAAGGVIAVQGNGTSEGRAREARGQTASPAVAAGLGVAAFAVTAGVSEVGLRGQRRVEQWADRVTGRPRLVIGVAGAALSLGADLAARRAGQGDA